MELKDILSKCDHTLLRQDCTSEEIMALCDQGIKYGCASVCIASAALIAYIPLLIVLLLAWYVVGHLL